MYNSCQKALSDRMKATVGKLGHGSDGVEKDKDLKIRTSLSAADLFTCKNKACRGKDEQFGTIP